MSDALPYLLLKVAVTDQSQNPIPTFGRIVEEFQRATAEYPTFADAPLSSACISQGWLFLRFEADVKSFEPAPVETIEDQVRNGHGDYENNPTLENPEDGDGGM